ncbi:DNA-binding Lrp family transcriptional regulator [Arthrobacter sp. B3I9]|uniref:Lrp/AsnC family transcriptional regulator n=1 Tax=Arthrobacter sp. B3I9 TaxID=3042270 RepID=UPI002790BA29|nr:Lrp/AsnC family transcriptional regulator [Arthrobacter sp. B3I9]MDQ0851339.1 DNA-binding Lrp family transcriptional regulator [Arthrobacter sp. B3I9]
MLDDLDRQIVAALIRNGRAPWRHIADVLGQQERTVARRGNRLLASGEVRVQSFPSPAALAPVDLYMLRVTAAPSAIPAIGTWLAQRPETHWISALAGASECIVELSLERDAVGPFLYGELAGLDGVRDLPLEPVFEYYRTVSGWRPDLLTPEQYEALSPSEHPQFAAGYMELGMPPLDEPSRALAELLRANGRITIEELAAGLGVSKATASRRLETLIADGAVFVRAILDPASIGYPVETLLTVRAEAPALDAAGRYIADLPATRWAANVSGRILVQTATRSLAELRGVMQGIATHAGVTGVDVSLFTRIFKRSTVAYRDGKLPQLADVDGKDGKSRTAPEGLFTLA